MAIPHPLRSSRSISVSLLLGVLGLFCILGTGTAPVAHKSLAAPRSHAARTFLADDLATAAQTAATLAATNAPVRDLYELTRRLRLHRTAPIDPYVGTGPHDYQVGRVDTFWVANAQTGYFQMQTKLVLKTPHAYWYFDTRVTPNMAALERSASVFETHTYPTDRANYGMEWTPGIDHDTRITILCGHLPGPVAGYFSAEDLYPKSVTPYSNQRKMIYFNVDGGGNPGTSGFDEVLAHEFQHMIHWHMHPRDDAWINEGSSMLAQALNGYTADGFDQEFTQMPDTQLDTWTVNSDRDIAHYGASFLWMLYFYQHYGGQKAVRTLLADSGKTGIALFNDVLHKLGSMDSADAMFANWVIANYINDPALAQGQYGYQNWHVQATVTQTLSTLPASLTGTVPPYATNYVAVKPAPGTTALTINFHGDSTVPLLSAPTSPGEWLWWSNRGDVMDTMLTHAYDLSGVKTATLHYTVWWDTEQDFDYGYVEVSTDNGVTWYTQHTAHTTNSDPNGANYGNGYTGQTWKAPGAPASGWLDETVDLSRYAGKHILVRFELITDDALNLQGVALQRLSIPEIGYSQDASTDTGWQSDGWVRVRNILPVNWLVQAIVQDGRGTHIVETPVHVGEGSLTLPVTSGAKVVLAISPLAPVTTVAPSYTLSVKQQ